MRGATPSVQVGDNGGPPLRGTDIFALLHNNHLPPVQGGGGIPNFFLSNITSGTPNRPLPK